MLAWGAFAVFMIVSFVLAFKDSADVAIREILR